MQIKQTKQKQVPQQKGQEPRSNQQQSESQIQKNQESPVVQEDVDGVAIFCKICNDYLNHAVTTLCQHSYCQICIEEYLIMLDQCPECKLKIRSQKRANNLLLDNLILDYIKKFQPQDIEQFQARLDEYKDYHKRKEITNLEMGMQVDIRDKEYVWCVGKVHKIINRFQEKKLKYAVVKFGSKKQELVQGSERLAAKGFYTDREDIPHYEKKKLVIKNTFQGTVYEINKLSDSDSN